MLDELIDSAVEANKEGGEEITCRIGCDYCCHLLVEIGWEEAQQLATWVIALPEPQREAFILKVRKNAAAARKVFSRRIDAGHCLQPGSSEQEIPDEAYDEYFFDNKIPCCFLESGKCAAYEARPIACRLHLVSSDPCHCSSATHREDEYEVPDLIEELKDETAPVIGLLEKDGRQGQLGIMVEAALDELLRQEKERSITRIRPCPKAAA